MTIRLSNAHLGVFFDGSHEALSETLLGDAVLALAGEHDPATILRRLGQLGLTAYLVPEASGGHPAGRLEDPTYVDVRSLVLVREALGQVNPLADALFAVQGLGTYPIVLAGTAHQQGRFLPDAIAGRSVAAFALTEPEAGSDVASLRTVAQRDGDGWILDGDKTLISNATVADHAVVFANAEPARGRAGITAFVVENDTPGLTVEPIRLSVPHPIGKLTLRGCRVPGEALLGAVGSGFRLAMQTLDTFRISVGAAAVGMAARALERSLEHVTRRRQFGAPLSDQPIVRAYLAEMATELEAARLLVVRAAHLRDTSRARVSVEAAMAKMYATEAAQRIIDRAVQLHGGLGVVEGVEVERLYREIRPLRLYEGTTEIQKLIIAKGLLDGHAAEAKNG